MPECFALETKPCDEWFRIIQNAECPSSEISRREAPGADGILFKATRVSRDSSLSKKVYERESLCTGMKGRDWSIYRASTGRVWKPEYVRGR